MKALVKRKAEEGLWLEDIPEPEMGINDVLIEVLRTGICGTDVHIYNWDAWSQKTVPVPLVIGHEFVGRIVDVGSNVKDFHPGEIVSGEGHVVCGRCRNCLAGRRHLCKDTKGIGVNRPGAFAEYLVLPMTNVWVHDPSIPRDIQSIFDPFGNAVHTALHFPVLGEDVLITGAGPIGIMAAAVVRHAGARYVVITDVNPYRLELARRMGATLAVDVRKQSIADAQQRAGHEGGLRRRPGDVGQSAGLPRHAGQHVPRRQDRHARHPQQGHGHRLADRRLQHAHDPGHLRPGNVRNLVQDDRHAPVRAGHHARSSPTAFPTPSSSRASTPCAPGKSGKVVLTWKEG